MHPHCENFSLVAYKQRNSDTIVMTRLRCGSWQCDYCARANRDEWLAFLNKRLPEVSKEWWFLTLTSHPDKREAAQSLENLRKNIDRLMKRVKRAFGNVDYVRTYETHLSGAYHAHFIVAGMSEILYRSRYSGGFTPHIEKASLRKKRPIKARTWFKWACWDVGMGYICDLQRLSNAKAGVRYVTKYLTKSQQNFHVKYLRHVQTTRRIGSPKHRSDGGWQVNHRVVKSDIPDGMTLYDLNLKLSVPVSYWTENEVYPLANSQY